MLVVLGLVISVVLSIAAKSLSDVVLSRQERENNAAFAIAESGVEQALLKISQGDFSGDNLADSTGLVTGSYSVAGVNSFDLFLKAGEQAEMDMSGYSGTVTISWTRTSDPSENVACSGEGAGNAPASLEIIAIKSSQTVEREYYDGYNSCVSGNGFADGSAGAGGFRSRVSYAVPANTAYLRVKPLYTGATVQVSGSGLSTQMYLVQSGAAGGDADKEIEVKRSRDSAGSIFDYALFSGETIVK